MPAAQSLAATAASHANWVDLARSAPTLVDAHASVSSGCGLAADEDSQRRQAGPASLLSIGMPSREVGSHLERRERREAGGDDRRDALVVPERLLQMTKTPACRSRPVHVRTARAVKQPSRLATDQLSM